MAEGLIHRRFLPACVKDARALACQQQRAYAPRVCFQKALVVRAGDDVGVFVVSLFLIKAGGKILRVRVNRDGEQRVVLRLKIIAEREAVRRQLIDQRGKNLFIGLLPLTLSSPRTLKSNSQSSLAWMRMPVMSVSDSSGKSSCPAADASSAAGCLNPTAHGYGLRRFVCGGQQHEAQQTDRRQRENSLRHATCPLSNLVYGVL